MIKCQKKVSKSNYTGGRPGRTSRKSDRTSAIVEQLLGHGRRLRTSDILGYPIDVRPDVRHCGCKSDVAVGRPTYFSFFFFKTLYIRLVELHFIHTTCINKFLSLKSLFSSISRMASSRAGGSGGGGSDSDSEDELEAVMERVIDRRVRQRAQRRQQAAVPRPIRQQRTHIPRERIAAHIRLYQDYFAPQPRFGDDIFRRRFRMHRPLFMYIVGALERRYEYFRIREDAAGKPGLTPLQKCTAAIRQLAYGGAADMFDEYLHIGESTAIECLQNFCAGVRAIFGDRYLRSPNPEDCQRLIDMHGTVHGFPGMLGSIDCMHWEWKNCPAAWKGMYTSGFKAKHPTMILEAVADYRLWIWHAYFGVAGSNNDLNVLQSSPLFNDQCNGVGPAISFVANGNQHDMGYYLADGIYPNWPVFVKTIKHAVGPKKTYFASRQEAARKDVERAFGVLQSRWAVVKGPSRMWYIPNIGDVMYACIIMHNMIVESEADELTQWSNEDDTGAGPSHGVATPNVNMGVPHGEVERLRAFADMRQKDAHIRLQHDIIEELWSRRGGR